MSNIEFNEINLRFKREVNSMTHLLPEIYREAIKEDAQKIITQFQPDIEKWIVRLKNKDMSCFEIESLLQSRLNEVSLNSLQQTCNESQTVEKIKNNILNLIAKSVLNTYLYSMFKDIT